MRPMHKQNLTIGLLMLAMLVTVMPVWAIRIKDVTHIEGIRDNQLIGYGLVVGLDGTGDGSSTEFTVRSLVSYLRKNGINLDPDAVKVDNVAAVIVTADLPPFSRSGMRLDVLVSSIGDAESLAGGTLLMTPLKGADGEVYAVAQGSVAVGGFKAEASGSSASANHVTAGKVPGGALIENAPPTRLEGRKEIRLLLDNPDFTTARRITEVVNRSYGPIARTVNATVVEMNIPEEHSEAIADFMAEVEGLPVHPDFRAKVVIDERTGTVVMGEDVRISTLAIAHGGLAIQIAKDNEVVQPYPYSLLGVTSLEENADIFVQDQNDDLTIVPEGVSLGEVVQSLNAIGVTPRDLISILQTIKASGALQAELEIR